MIGTEQHQPQRDPQLQLAIDHVCSFIVLTQPDLKGSWHIPEEEVQPQLRRGVARVFEDHGWNVQFVDHYMTFTRRHGPRGCRACGGTSFKAMGTGASEISWCLSCGTRAS